MPRSAFIPGALQHIAFALPDLAAAHALRERLAALDIATTEIGDLGLVQNMLFRDNSGILLETTWPKA